MQEIASEEIVEALWESSLEQGHDDECGEAWQQGWYAIFRFAQDEWDNGVKGVGVAPFVGAILNQQSDGAKRAWLFDVRSELETAWRTYVATLSDRTPTLDKKTGDEKGKIKIVLVLTLEGDAGDAYGVVSDVLDNGTFQDAIAEYAGDNDHDVSVRSVVLVSGGDNVVDNVRALLAETE